MPFSDIGVFLGNLVFKGFEHFSSNAMPTQKKILEKILDENKNTEYGKKYGFKDIHSIEEYQDKVPLTTYVDYDEYVDRMVNNGETNLIMKAKTSRYCSSSGSVGKPKVLPKAKKDLWNMQCMGFAASVACAANHIHREGKKFPKQVGPLVMVLTGHPLKDGKMCNGAGQVPLTYLKPITRFFSTSPLSLLYPEHEEQLDVLYLQLRFCLERKDVSYIGSLVITLVTTMFEYLENNWQMLCDDIEKGTINPGVKITPELRKKYEKKFKPHPERAAFLRKEFEKGFDTPIVPRIWPKASWVYGMIGSNLALYVDKLKKYTGDLPIHNMGYAAAEGFMAMALDLNKTDYAILPRSLLYEFIPVDDQDARPLTLDKVEVGKEYIMVVTNYSGLYRYNIEDVVKVTGHHNQVPTIEFLYRINLGMNIANEKTTTQMLDYAAKEIAKSMNTEFEGHSFYSDYSTNPPHYVMLAEPLNDDLSGRNEEAEALLDEKMKDSNEKYFKYRRWGMIGDPEVRFLKKNTYFDYREMLRARGVVLNQIKPVTVINSKEREDFFFSHAEERVTK